MALVETLTRQLIEEKRLLTWRYLADEYDLRRGDASLTLHKIILSLSNGQESMASQQPISNICITFTMFPSLSDPEPQVRSHLWIANLTGEAQALPSDDWLMQRFGTTDLHKDLYVESIALTHTPEVAETKSELNSLQHTELKSVASLFLHAMNANKLYIPRSLHPKISAKIKPRRDQSLQQKTEAKETPSNCRCDVKSPVLVPSKQVAPPTSPVPKVDTHNTATHKSTNQRRGSSTTSKAASKSSGCKSKQSDCRAETAEVNEPTRHTKSSQKTGNRVSPCYETPSLEVERAPQRNLFDSDEEAETEEARSKAPPLSTCLDEEEDLSGILAQQMGDRTDEDKRPTEVHHKTENTNQPSAQLLENGDGFVYKKLMPAKEDIPPQGPLSGNNVRPAQSQGAFKSVSPVAASKEDSKKSAKRQHSQMGLESFFKGSCKRQKNSA